MAESDWNSDFFLQRSAEVLESEATGDWPEVGHFSQDRIAIIGKEKFVFIHNGRNNYYAAYSKSETDVFLAETWATYIEQIRSTLSRSGVPFLFCLVPNKATVLPHLYPLPLSGFPTARCQLLLEMLGHEDRIAFDRFCSSNFPKSIFRRNDSHLTEFGNILLADTILKFANAEPDWSKIDLDKVKPCQHAGDLGARCEPKTSEIFKRVQYTTSQCKIVEKDYKERRGQLVGLEYTAVNPAAPTNKRILVFGNSFVERVPSWGAAMPICTSVSDFRFVWYPAVDIDLVKAWEPDLVVFQTCERFLSAAPAV
jgi:hypothetical protein